MLWVRYKYDWVNYSYYVCLDEARANRFYDEIKTKKGVESAEVLTGEPDIKDLRRK